MVKALVLKGTDMAVALGPSLGRSRDASSAMFFICDSFFRKFSRVHSLEITCLLSEISERLVVQIINKVI